MLLTDLDSPDTFAATHKSYTIYLTFYYNEL